MQCDGVELGTIYTRIGSYFASAVIIGFALLNILVVFKTGVGKFNHFLWGSDKPTQKNFWLAMVLGLFVMGLFAVPYEIYMAKNYTYCYKTNGEYRKEGGYFDVTNRWGDSGIVQEALYVKKDLRCPYRDLFMYWYDENGRKFQSLTNYPPELNERIPTLKEEMGSLYKFRSSEN